MHKIFYTALLLFLSIAAFNAAYAINEALRDPTCPPGVTAAGVANPASLQVDSILIAKDRKIVFLGHKALTIGDSLMDEKIIDINKNALILQGKDKRIVLPMAIKNPKVAHAK